MCWQFVCISLWLAANWFYLSAGALHQFQFESQARRTYSYKPSHYSTIYVSVCSICYIRYIHPWFIGAGRTHAPRFPIGISLMLLLIAAWLYTIQLRFDCCFRRCFTVALLPGDIEWSHEPKIIMPIMTDRRTMPSFCAIVYNYCGRCGIRMARHMVYMVYSERAHCDSWVYYVILWGTCMRAKPHFKVDPFGRISIHNGKRAINRKGALISSP